jgi:hypothetical protein
MANPHTLNWTNPTTNTDGSALTEAENAGYQISLDGGAAVSIPLAWGTTFDMSSLAAYEALKSGAHTVTLALVTTAGVVGVASNAASFSIAAVPSAPTGLTVS